MSELEAARPPRMGLAVVAYVVSLLASIWIVRTYSPGPALQALIFAVPVASLAAMIVQGVRARRFRGNVPCGGRAYQRRVVGLALAYVLLLLGANWLFDHYALTGALAVAVAVLPALPLVGMIAAMGRMILDEKDEYQRMLHVRQMLVATGLTLAVCTIWGFLEEFGLAPHVAAYWVFVLWCGGLGFGTIYNESRP